MAVKEVGLGHCGDCMVCAEKDDPQDPREVPWLRAAQKGSKSRTGG